jgi:hypothetical protein
MNRGYVPHTYLKEYPTQLAIVQDETNNNEEEEKREEK